ncbi:MBL fold metallo-hydrolase [Babesia caballi]|uniref:MBL fold metallo-hydrolase n=1 Tax=Babesia caballi TaxID=5871 RepID=A0AAV4LQD2_BABCB|nr:MBL fold metallo-hydrolase [Babesia caballi]
MRDVYRNRVERDVDHGAHAPKHRVLQRPEEGAQGVLGPGHLEHRNHENRRYHVERNDAHLRVVVQYGVEQIVDEAPEGVQGGGVGEGQHLAGSQEDPYPVGVLLVAFGGRLAQRVHALCELLHEEPAVLVEPLEHRVTLRSGRGAHAEPDDARVVVRHLDVRQLQAAAAHAAVGRQVEHPAAEGAHVVVGEGRRPAVDPRVGQHCEPDDAGDFLEREHRFGDLAVAQQVPVHEVAQHPGLRGVLAPDEHVAPALERAQQGDGRGRGLDAEPQRVQRLHQQRHGGRPGPRVGDGEAHGQDALKVALHIHVADAILARVEQLGDLPVKQNLRLHFHGGQDGGDEGEKGVVLTTKRIVAHCAQNCLPRRRRHFAEQGDYVRVVHEHLDAYGPEEDGVPSRLLLAVVGRVERFDVVDGVAHCGVPACRIAGHIPPRRKPRGVVVQRVVGQHRLELGDVDHGKVCLRPDKVDERFLRLEHDVAAPLQVKGDAHLVRLRHVHHQQVAVHLLHRGDHLLLAGSELKVVPHAKYAGNCDFYFAHGALKAPQRVRQGIYLGADQRRVDHGVQGGRLACVRLLPALVTGIPLALR